jgi:response regulator RpfG family c-di-GMP phosphodiesterase
MMAVVVFIKLRMTIGNNTTNNAFFSITQAGYALIYFSLVVLALYQDSKLLKMIFKVAIILMTIVHVTILYPVYLYAYDFSELFNYLKGPIITDIILRTLVLAVFMIALYSTARITEDMNNKRKEELIKRRAMEKDFKTVVSDVFDVISVYKRPGSADLDIAYDLAAKRVADLSSRLGNYLGFSPKLCKEIYDFSTIHIDKKSLLTIEDYDNKEVLDEVDFKKIREKTIIGSIIIKRLQLDQKAEEIVRAHFEKTANSDFIKDMNGIQNNRESQVILLAQMYEILRQDRNYKRGLKHSRAIDLLQLEFYPYFDSQILDRFIKYGEDFEALYYKITKE